MEILIINELEFKICGYKENHEIEIEFSYKNYDKLREFTTLYNTVLDTLDPLKIFYRNTDLDIYLPSIYKGIKEISITKFDQLYIKLQIDNNKLYDIKRLYWSAIKW